MDIELTEGRFARFEAIEWWDQELLTRSKVFVAGAGALGNEVIKNLALLGIGNIVIADMDRIEMSNLSRSVLYRADDEGKLKADCAAAAAKHIFPEIKVRSLAGNLLGDVGLGFFRWADVVIGALDNREARVFMNSSCAQVGTPWIDGGIEVLNGIARGFHAPEHACYECTMSKTDWDLLNKRRSCSLLARRAIQERGTPTTPTTASVIGGIQVQEAVKLLHGRNDFLGKGFFFDGSGHDSYSISYRTNPDCEWHDEVPPVEDVSSFNSRTPLRAIWDHAERSLGGITEIEFSREIVHTLDCPDCGDKQTVLKTIVNVPDHDALCEKCNTERSPTPIHCVRSETDALLDEPLSAIGIPRRDILWARHGTSYLGIEIAGDDVFAGI